MLVGFYRMIVLTRKFSMSDFRPGKYVAKKRGARLFLIFVTFYQRSKPGGIEEKKVQNCEQPTHSQTVLRAGTREVR